MIRRQTQSSRCRQDGMLITELVVALAILAAVMIPLAFALEQENRACRASYNRAVAMEIVDGEMEILAAGEWRAFPPGERVYSVRAEAAKQLPAGRFLLTIDEHRVRLAWLPAQRGQGHEVIREIRIP